MFRMTDWRNAAVAALQSWRRQAHIRRQENRAIAQLRAYSDADLADLGLARSEIERAVRYGRTHSISI